MYCEQCGAKLVDGTKFCTKCGVRVEEVVLISTEKKETPIKRVGKIRLLFGIMGILLFLAVSGSVIWKLGFEKKGGIAEQGYEKNLRIYRYKDAFYNAKGDVFKVENGIHDFSSNVAGTEIVYEDEYGGVFRLENKNGTALKSTAIDEEASSCKIAYSGIATAWLHGTQEGKGTLKVLFDEKSEVQILNDNVWNYAYVFSPDGKTILYLGDYKDAEHNILYKSDCTNGDTEKIDVNVKAPVALSENGKGIYYIKNDDKLYYTDGMNSQCLSENGIRWLWGNIHFNRSCTEALFLDGKGELIIFTEKDRNARVLKKQETLGLSADADWCDEYFGNIPMVYHIDIDDFGGCIVFGVEREGEEGEYCWIDPRTEELIPITMNGENVESGHSVDDETFMTSRDGNAYMIPLGEEGSAECIYDGGDIKYICENWEEKEIFIITESNVKYYKNSEEKATIPLETGTSCMYNFGLKKILYLMENGNLYAWDPRMEEPLKLVDKNVTSLKMEQWGKPTLYEIDNGEKTLVYIVMSDGSGKFLFSYQENEE